jgi:hypothetical protein
LERAAAINHRRWMIPLRRAAVTAVVRSFNIAKDPVHIHDFNATILRTLGIDHERLTFKSQGRDFRLTDVHGKVVKDVLA